MRNIGNISAAVQNIETGHVLFYYCMALLNYLFFFRVAQAVSAKLYEDFDSAAFSQ